jgi:hypothetical protein
LREIERASDQAVAGLATGRVLKVDLSIYGKMKDDFDAFEI